MSDKIRPPWTSEQVAALNDYQTAGWVHPFTCPNRSNLRHRVSSITREHELVATADGWVCRVCDYTQDWAHAFMADPEVGKAMREQLRG
jgi:hypothetical protein